MTHNDLMEFAKRWSEAEAQQPKSAHTGTCPNCGYCPHCGRGGQQLTPYPGRNYYGPMWIIPLSTGGTMTLTATSANWLLDCGLWD